VPVPQTRIAADVEVVLSNDSRIIAAAGLRLATWQSPPHVFRRISRRFIAGRNRGRLPFLEYDIAGETAELLNRDAFTFDLPVTVRARVLPRPDQSHAAQLEAFSHAIQRAVTNWWFGDAAGAQRSEIEISDASQLYHDSDIGLGELAEDHMSAYRDVQIVIRHVSARSDLGNVD